MTKILITIDKKKCVGCASCTLNAPEVFMMSPKGHSVIREKYRNENNELKGIVPESLYEKVKKAANRCLGSAIKIYVKKE